MKATIVETGEIVEVEIRGNELIVTAEVYRKMMTHCNHKPLAESENEAAKFAFEITINGELPK